MREKNSCDIRIVCIHVLRTRPRLEDIVCCVHCVYTCASNAHYVAPNYCRVSGKAERMCLTTIFHSSLTRENVSFLLCSRYPSCGQGFSLGCPFPSDPRRCNIRSFFAGPLYSVCCWRRILFDRHQSCAGFSRLLSLSWRFTSPKRLPLS